MSQSRYNTKSNQQPVSDTKKMSNTGSGSSNTTTPTPSRMVPQLPSPPETLSESPVHSSEVQDFGRPSTPNRTHLDPRYPTSLGPGRVPLHRRGTSKTYERLEDLLAAEGYKDVRVFTPEAERAEVEAEERKEREVARGRNGSVRDGVGAVVGFITGLMSRNSSLARDSEERAEPVIESRKSPPLRQEYSPPPSPLAHKQELKPKRTNSSSIHSHSAASNSPMTPVFMSSTESLTRSPLGSSSNLSTTYRVTKDDPNSTPRAYYPDPHSRSSRLRPHSSLSSHPAPQTYAQASKARAYLRHMASAPSIQPAKKLKLDSLQRHSSMKYAASSRYSGRTTVLNDSGEEEDYLPRRGNGEGEDEADAINQPPLPLTWLESVARAVLFGGTGAHVGGPSSSRSQSLSPKSRLGTLQKSHTSSKSALVDNTNTIRSAASKNRAQPSLLTRVSSKRSPSESRVSRTRVVCHSAPGSRSGSRARGNDLGSRDRVERGRERSSPHKAKERLTMRKFTKGKGKDYHVPTLARTKAHNDDWAHADTESCTSSEDDDEEGEVDLARLLVPSKRQNSIRSLRKHLHGQSRTASHHSLVSASGGLRSRRGSRRDEEDEEQGFNARYISRNARDEHEGSSERRNKDSAARGTSAKRRRAIPADWEQ